jgi:hypothetical protein
MKYLKKYRLFESVNEEEIHDICKEFNIENYTINRDGTIDVNGSVNLPNKGLTKLPLKFNKVSGNFSCSYNQLTTLEGAPKSVSGDFYCRGNKLTSLKGAPKSVGGDFHCQYNQLKKLEATQSIGGNFNCFSNELTSLEGAPQSVGGKFDCSKNKLTSLEGAPQSVGVYFNFCNNQLTSLEGLEFKLFDKIYLKDNPVYLIVKDWINNDNREELIEYFIDMNIIQEGLEKPKLIMMRLEEFYDDMNLEMDIDFEEVKKHYKIIE